MNKIKTLILPRLAATGLALLAMFASAAAAAPVEIVALGDSLTVGYGLAPGESFPEQLEAALRARGYDVTVANAGVSGDTASGAVARLEWAVPMTAEIVIVELGANDALRGIDPGVTRAALSNIIGKLKERRQRVLLAGMMAPRNLGDDYVRRFDAIYPELAAEHEVPLYPFFLEGVATDAALNQADGLHPTAAGVAKIVQAIVPHVEALLGALAESG